MLPAVSASSFVGECASETALDCASGRTSLRAATTTPYPARACLSHSSPRSTRLVLLILIGAASPGLSGDWTWAEEYGPARDSRQPPFRSASLMGR